jgi:hypothetical protein
MGWPIGQGQALSPPQQAFIGQTVCCLCDGLAALIGEPRSWRVAALVSTTQLMPRGLSLFAAATAGATATRKFAARSRALNDEFREIGQMGSKAVAQNSELLVQQLRVHIANRMNDSPRSDGVHVHAPDAAFID